jgi:hypothetical protein
MNNRVKIIESEGRLLVYSPYCAEFVSDAKKKGGRWDSEHKAWSFDARALELVKTILIDNYGTDGTPCELVTVKVRAKKAISELQGSVAIMGRVIARATGRDSGAKLGEGVSMVSGEVKSGGSRANWCTWIQEGSEFLIYDMPKTILDYEWHEFDVSKYKDIREKIDRVALESELAEIEARASQIRALLEKGE